MGVLQHYFFLFHHRQTMRGKTILHATSTLLYPCWRYPKCPWGLYASPPPQAMALVKWLLCFFYVLFFFFFFFFFFREKSFFSTRNVRLRKGLHDVRSKKFWREKNPIYAEREKHATYAQRNTTHLARQSNYAFPRGLLPSCHCPQ